MSHLLASHSSADSESLDAGLKYFNNQLISNPWHDERVLAHRVNDNGQAEYLVKRWEETSKIPSEAITEYWNRYYYANKAGHNLAYIYGRSVLDYKLSHERPAGTSHAKQPLCEKSGRGEVRA
jgi:hypothetical protein